MKRFTFSLDRVLKLKEQRERLAELQQRQTRAVWEAAKAVVASIWDAVAAEAKAWQVKIGATVSASEWLAHSDHVAVLAASQERAEAQERAAAERYRAAEAYRVQMTKEVEALRYLRHEQWKAHWDEVMHQEQLRLDELGMRRWADGTAATPVS